MHARRMAVGDQRCHARPVVLEVAAVQRNARAARLLGVTDDVARKSALYYYNVTYQRRAEIGGLAGSYYSSDCAPGKSLDEHLADSTWAGD